MKIVLTEEEDGDDGHAHAYASERSGDGEGEPKRGVSQTEHNNGKGTGEIVSYARWKLPSDVKEKLEKEYPEYSRVKLSLKDLMEPNAERRVGYGAKGELIRLNKQMREVEQTLESKNVSIKSPAAYVPQPPRHTPQPPAPRPRHCTRQMGYQACRPGRLAHLPKEHAGRERSV